MPVHVYITEYKVLHLYPSIIRNILVQTLRPLFRSVAWDSRLVQQGSEKVRSKVYSLLGLRWLGTCRSLLGLYVG